MIRTCSIVVGMHPDQATEPAIELALALGKPFAIVPCCVYSKECPKRRVIRQSGEDAGQATSYDAFLDYLQAKHPEITRGELDFEGKATVLFMHATSPKTTPNIGLKSSVDGSSTR